MECFLSKDRIIKPQGGVNYLQTGYLQQASVPIYVETLYSEVDDAYF